MFDDQDRPCNSLSDIIRSQTRLRADQYCAEYLSLTNCVACATEFVVACLDSEWAPGGKALYLTTWKDYGACENPFDLRWRGHVAPYNCDLSTQRAIPYLWWEVSGTLLRLQAVLATMGMA